MALTKKSNIIIPEILEQAVRGALPGMKVLLGSSAVATRGNMHSSNGGDAVTVPYFGSLGELEDTTEGEDLTVRNFGMTSETASVIESGKAFSITDWAKFAASDDVYGEAKRQILEMVTRRVDKALVDAAVAPLPSMTLDRYSATVPRTIDYDLMVDGKMKWGDEQSDVAMAIVHSKVLGDLYKIKKADGAPMLVEPTEGNLGRFAGLPLLVSDRCPVDVSGGISVPVAFSSSGTPPVITTTGTPNRKIDLRVEAMSAGTLTNWTLRYSIDGGKSWSATIASAATILMYDPLVPEQSTGVTLAIAAGTAATNHYWTAATVNKYTSVLVKKNAMAFWYNPGASIETDRNILAAADVCATHIWFVAHRYTRLQDSVYPGVVLLKHN